ncbi:MAG: response regulator [Deltaproteobacteria bacterium]|nr:response regulator [Deltaproteobacteria bacterium]
MRGQSDQRSRVAKKVLIVEDSPESVELTVDALCKCGINTGDIAITSDGQEGLDYIFGAGKYSGRDVKDVPELVLLDLKLPKVSGFEILEKIRADERTRLIPVVILSVSSLREDVLRSYRSGANSFIVKPMNYEEYIKTVRIICNYWLVINKKPQV